MPKTYPPRLTGADRTAARQKAAHLYVAGCSVRSVAQQIGRSYGLTHLLLTEAKVRFRTRGGHMPPTSR